MRAVADPVLRVLVVDDRKKDQDIAAKAVRAACLAASLSGDVVIAETYEDAVGLVARTYFDLLIVDLVLHSGIPGDIEGWEGLWLLQDLAEMGLQAQSAVVVLTSFGDVNVANLTLSRFKALRIWDKHPDTERLTRDLLSLLEEQAFFGLRSKVSLGTESWPSLVSALGRQQFRGSPFPISAEEGAFELEHLLRRLFADVDEFDVAVLRGGYSGAGVLRVKRSRAGGHLADVVAKYGSAPDMRAEQAGFEELSEYTQAHRATQLVASTMGRYLGAVQYSFLGSVLDEFVPFSEFYSLRSAGEVSDCLRRLFLGNCSLWFDSANRRSSLVSLQEAYASELGYSVATLEQAFTFKFGEFPHSSEISFIEVSRQLPHPVAALRTGTLAAEVDTWLCPTHGDLHGGNLLVHRDSGDAWLIDFAGAGYGHWARDFAALECSIKFQYLPATRLDALYELEDAFASLPSLGGDVARVRSADAEIAKAARVVGEVRSVAAELVRPYDLHLAAREYYVALYFSTLNYLRFHWRLKKKVRKNQILMAAAVALERARGFD